MKVVALGRTHWLYDAIEAVAARGHDVVLVGTAPEAPEYTRTPDDFLRLADELGCPGFNNASLGAPGVQELLRDTVADVCISVNWPTLIPASVRDLYPWGILNGHAGALPRYRGNACPNWAMIAGESRLGITVHQMADALDAGPVVIQEFLTLSSQHYIADIYAELARVFPRLFADAVDGLATGVLRPHPQSADPADALRCHPRQPIDGALDWGFAATDLATLVRASADPFAGAFTWHRGACLRVWRADATTLETPVLGVPGQVIHIDHDVGTVTVLCGDGALVLQDVSVDSTTASERVLPATVIRSTRDRLSMNVFEELQRTKARLAVFEG